VYFLDLYPATRKFFWKHLGGKMPTVAYNGLATCFTVKGTGALRVGPLADSYKNDSFGHDGIGCGLEARTEMSRRLISELHWVHDYLGAPDVWYFAGMSTILMGVALSVAPVYTALATGNHVALGLSVTLATAYPTVKALIFVTNAFLGAPEELLRGVDALLRNWRPKEGCQWESGVKRSEDMHLKGAYKFLSTAKVVTESTDENVQRWREATLARLEEGVVMPDLGKDWASKLGECKRGSLTILDTSQEAIVVSLTEFLTLSSGNVVGEMLYFLDPGFGYLKSCGFFSHLLLKSIYIHDIGVLLREVDGVWHCHTTEKGFVQEDSEVNDSESSAYSSELAPMLGCCAGPVDSPRTARQLSREARI